MHVATSVAIISMHTVQVTIIITKPYEYTKAIATRSMS